MNNKTYTPEEIQKRFDSLPQDIKALVYSADMLNLVQKIGEKYQVHLDKLEILESEIADIMTGFSDANKFVANLVESLQIDEVKANAIAKDVNDALFNRIRESMKKVYEQSTAPLPTVQKNPPAVSMSSTAPTLIPSPVPKPAPPAPAVGTVEVMLSQPTVSVPKTPVPVAKVDPAKPNTYKTDPYREPAE